MAASFPHSVDAGFSMGANGEIFHTNNGGIAWVPMFDVGSNTLYGAQFPVDSAIGFAAASSENIWKTTDSAKS